jgi:hypothetical protein
VSLGSQALVTDDTGERKRYVHFPGGFQDEPDVLDSSLESKPGLVVVAIGDAVDVFRHGLQKALERVDQSDENASFFV